MSGDWLPQHGRLELTHDFFQQVAAYFKVHGWETPGTSEQFRQAVSDSFGWQIQYHGDEWFFVIPEDDIEVDPA